MPSSSTLGEADWPAQPSPPGDGQVCEQPAAVRSEGLERWVDEQAGAVGDWARGLDCEPSGHSMAAGGPTGSDNSLRLVGAGSEAGDEDLTAAPASVGRSQAASDAGCNRMRGQPGCVFGGMAVEGPRDPQHMLQRPGPRAACTAADAAIDCHHSDASCLSEFPLHSLPHGVHLSLLPHPGWTPGTSLMTDAH